MTSADRLRPAFVRNGEGDRARVINDLVTIKSRASDTGGAYSLSETVTLPAEGCPTHAHRHEEKTFYVLEGKYLFRVGEESNELSQGDCLFVPRGATHAFTNVGSDLARMLVFVTPGGIYESFLNEIGDCSDRHGLEPDMARVLAVAPKYGIEFSLSDSPRHVTE